MENAKPLQVHEMSIRKSKTIFISQFFLFHAIRNSGIVSPQNMIYNVLAGEGAAADDCD